MNTQSLYMLFGLVLVSAILHAVVLYVVNESRKKLQRKVDGLAGMAKIGQLHGSRISYVVEKVVDRTFLNLEYTPLTFTEGIYSATEFETKELAEQAARKAGFTEIVFAEFVS